MNNYTNRELSWLSFNERVIELAKDNSIPFNERFNYLSISGSNLDEFRETVMLDRSFNHWDGISNIDNKN